MNPDTTTSRLSYLVEHTKARADWSPLRKKLKALEPGDVLTVTCPAGAIFDNFRSSLSVIGNRLHRDKWRLSTRTEGRKIHCYLSPRNADPEPE